jgi:hypothetical protein
VRARRRLPFIAGMALSAVVIAAPAAQADEFQPRQDCSKTEVEAEENYGGLLGLDRVLTVAGQILYPSYNGDEEIRAENRSDHVLGDRVDIDIDDSFNCANFVNDSFNKKDDHRRDDHRKWIDDKDDHRNFDDRKFDHRKFDHHHDHKFDHRDHGFHHGFDHHKFHHWGR